MSKETRAILLKYWGYSAFRPMQEDIVDSAVAGNDCLALLPTGGGKSVCFQVPAMYLDGLCLVITPLIALMKDQVQHLKKVGIPAAALFSGMHFQEQEIVYNQAVFGRLKFLYISPERLATDRFIEAVKRMKVCLIAVDESHCISQWGYDFRPPYLRIAEIRPYLPKTPVMALTATATPQVVDDIMTKLNFRSRLVFQTSYERKNLTYNVIYQPDKYGSMLRLLTGLVKGSAIVYVRNRKRTREIAEYLTSRGISATHYHAGLETKVRDQRQAAWMRTEYRVMVATNAFGMGIDKPDVRMVLHLDLPDSLEAYFQEAGRGGRDGLEAKAYLICNDNDVQQLKVNLDFSFPELKTIRDMYQALGNFLQLPVGSGKDQSFDFDMLHFSKHYNFQAVEVYNALKLLEKEGMLMLSEGMNTPSRLMFTAGREDLYRYQVEQPYYDPFIKHLLRNYPGIFTDFVVINEEEIARKTAMDHTKVIQFLNHLQKLGFLAYNPRKEKPQLVFLWERVDSANITLSPQHYAHRKKSAEIRVQAVIDFINNKDVCRNIQLLGYFGENQVRRCGTCDVCSRRNSLSLTDIEYDHISGRLKAMLSERPMPLFEAVKLTEGFSEEKVLSVVRWMIDNKMVVRDDDDRISMNQQIGMFN
jgi:ATP-dependent DNA helicase RecQ